MPGSVEGTNEFVSQACVGTLLVLFSFSLKLKYCKVHVRVEDDEDEDEYGSFIVVV